MALMAYRGNASKTAPVPARLRVLFLLLGVGLAVGSLLGTMPLAITVLVVAGGIGVLLALGVPYAGGCLLVCALVAVTDAEAGYEQRVWPLRDICKIPGLPSALWSFFLVLFSGAMFRLYFIRRECSRISLRYLAWYVGLLLFAAAVGLHNGWPLDGMHTESLRFLYPVMFFFLALHLFDSLARIQRVLWLLFGSTAFTAAVISCFYLSGKGVTFEMEGAGKGARIVTDDSGILMTITAMLLLALAYIMSGRASRTQTLLLTMGCLPLLFALLFSFRRAEWIGAAGGVAVLLLCGTHDERVRLLCYFAPAVPVMLLVFGVLACQAGPLNLAGNLSRRFDTLLDGRHSSNRYHMFESLQTLKDISQQPFTGLGLAARHGPLPQYPNSEVPRNVVHNAWLFIWMKFGLPGLLALLWVCMRYLRHVVDGLRCRAYAAGRPFLLALVALAPIWMMQSVSGPMPWYPRETMQVALYSAMVLNLVYLGQMAAGQAGARNAALT